jgi:hypothetical protein
MKSILLVSSLFLLTGCTQSAVTLLAPEYKVIKAPESLYNCPVEERFPRADSLTDQQVGTLLLKLQRNNITCKQSMEAIRQFYDDAEKTLATKK